MATGTITHIEFPAHDVERAKRFYTAVAGWDFNEMQPGYWTFRTEEGHGGGIGEPGEGIGDKVRAYITVSSVDASVKVAEANGGRLVTPPTDIAGGYGRYAAVIDTEGNEIGLWQSPPEG